jgi:hypothetical protein
MMKKLVFLTLALVVAASTVAVAGVHIVGGGTPNTANTFPWGNRPGMRWQTMWFKSELNEAGLVSKIEWQIYASIPGAGGVYSSCDILLCNTTVSALTSTYASNYGTATPVNVFTGTYRLAASPVNAWVTIVSPTNFTYTNTGNLLMEVSWSSATGGSNFFKYRSTGSSHPGRVYNTSSGAKTATTGTLHRTYHQYGRITITPTAVEATSLGRVKSLFR